MFGLGARRTSAGMSPRALTAAARAAAIATGAARHDADAPGTSGPPSSASGTRRGYVQASLDELDEPLRTTTFVVVDLETTGGAAGSDAITEIGAVRVRGGEIEGEFQSLVDPERGITPFVQVLTGITDSMVIGAPRIAEVLPAFVEFARGAVLVAHNAPFDVGFLKAAAQATGQAWPTFAVVDTAVLARRVLNRDEVPNCKLATLAPFFSATTQPNHRALADARATVDVLHGLIGRLGSLGVQSLPELRAFTAAVSLEQRRKRHLGDHLPEAPGVYVFRDARGEPLYVGTSRSLRGRVRNYFVASETRTRMGEMVGLAERVDGIQCAHALEAQVREIRLIGAHKPRYNKRSKFPERVVWLKLTREAFPRLSIVHAVREDGGTYLGPLRSQKQAEALRDAIHDAVPLRQCTDRLVEGRRTRPACALAGMHRCSAPCEGGVPAAEYAELAGQVARAWSGDVGPLVEPLRRRLDQLSAQGRFEEAATVRDRIVLVVRACARMQRLSALTRLAELVAARPDGGGGWELVVVRHGRLAAAGTAPRGVPPMPVVEALRATADEVVAGPGPLAAAPAEEAELTATWLEADGTRLIHTSGPWTCPAWGAGRLRRFVEIAADARAAATPFADRRTLPMASRPVRAAG